MIDEYINKSELYDYLVQRRKYYAQFNNDYGAGKVDALLEVLDKIAQMRSIQINIDDFNDDFND